MKKLIMLMILMAGFVVCQAMEKHPPGEPQNVVTQTLNDLVVPDGSMLFNVVQSYAFNVVEDYVFLQEFSNSLTSMKEERLTAYCANLERWYPLSAGGIAYADSKGPLKCNSYTQNLIQYYPDGLIEEALWLKNECIRQC